MSYKKKVKSVVMNKAAVRLAGMTQIDTDKARVIDYGDTGNTLTKVEFAAKMQLCTTLMQQYNKMLDQADAISNNFDAAEGELNDMCASVLAGAEGKFGRNSNELEELGGTRLVDRKKPVRKAKPAATK